MPDAVAAPTELTSFILAEVQRQTSEDALRKIVETKIGDSVKSAVDSAFRAYGHVGQQIEKAVANSLSIGDRIDIPSYSNMVMTLLRAKLDETVSDFDNSRLAEQMDQILNLAPKEVKFSEVIAEMKTHAKDLGSNPYGRVTVLIDDGHSDGWYRVGLDPHDDIDKAYKCETEFAVTNEGKIYSLNVDRRDVSKVISLGPYWGYQRMLFAAYACGSKLIMDERNPSVEYGEDY